MTLAVVQGPASATIHALFGTLVVLVTATSMGPIATLRDRTGGPLLRDVRCADTRPKPSKDTPIVHQSAADQVAAPRDRARSEAAEVSARFWRFGGNYTMRSEKGGDESAHAPRYAARGGRSTSGCRIVRGESAAGLQPTRAARTCNNEPRVAHGSCGSEFIVRLRVASG